ncbi:sensor histidine kinase [Siminovitchia terrae]|uniref:sensor histidine kinase n=1 Tax=Siminovitchia terrae TaxID=1914933 RepID=UPI001FE62868|nr:histidine kinase N-terminal domain-containing protein [Siminovitchia terrae]
MAHIKSAREICRTHTQLSEEDIAEIEKIESNLQLIADLNQANIFIDCPTQELKHAIIVAEAVPSNGNSLYDRPVTGEFAYEAFEPAVFFTLRTGKQMILNRALTQEGKMVKQSVVPVNGKDGRVIGTLIMEKDITEQVEEEDKMKALSKATATLSDIMIRMTQNDPIVPEIIEESLFYIDENDDIVYVNPSAMNLIYEIYGSKCNVGEPITEYLPFIEELLSLPETLLMREIQIKSRFFQLKKISLNHNNNKASGTFIILQDLTELKEKERQLIVKSVAIREIHHRVKNNLQTVASLLRLQMRNGVPEASKPHFQKSLNRILSIAAVYELILSGSSADDVNVLNLVEKIAHMIVYSEPQKDISVQINYEKSNLQLSSHKAVSIALIISELIQNCVKHAFKGNSQGKIIVDFKKNNDRIEMKVIDNGIGYSKDTGASFGLDIVKMMVEYDLEGEFYIQRMYPGTVATVIFQSKENHHAEQADYSSGG